MTTCILCKRVLAASSIAGVLEHPEADDCLVRFTDEHGIAIRELPEVADGREPNVRMREWGDVQLFPPIDEVLEKVFRDVGLERLGGASTGDGWSSISTFQQCPYRWKRRYIEPLWKPEEMLDDGSADIGVPEVDRDSRAVGSIIHALLAIYYSRMIIPDYPLTPESARDAMLEYGNPEHINEGYRVFTGYAIYYHRESIQPLAVEQDLVHPVTRKSCRYDLIAYFPDKQGELLPGTYILEHKSSGRFDHATLYGWANDGEVLGQVLLWKDLHLDLRYGPLRGVIVNLLGKQKEPKFHRTIVAPETWQIDQHRHDIAQTGHEIRLAVLNNHFPRKRASCIGRWGMCDFYDHCATNEG